MASIAKLKGCRACKGGGWRWARSFDRRPRLVRNCALGGDDVLIDATSHSRGMICPEFCISFALFTKRAQGRPGARRTRGPMCDSCNKMLHMSIQVWRRHPAFPAQWLYGLYEIVLVTLLFVTPSLLDGVGRLRT